jgi:hypothetical protein
MGGRARYESGAKKGKSADDAPRRRHYADAQYFREVV